MSVRILLLLLMNAGLLSVPRAQSLEPRLLTNLPIGTNFIVGGYNYLSGDLVLDAALPLEDLNGTTHSGAIGYVRSIRVGKQSGKINIVLPFASGSWSGKINGMDSTRSQSGIGDLSLRFSYNFTGSPAVEMKDYANYKQDFVAGFSFQVFLPTGAYENTHLINIGTNRFRFRTILGASKMLNKWILELYGALWIFTPNHDLLEGNNQSQRPLGGFKLHVIRTLPKGMWVTLDAGYAVGGRAIINGTPRNVKISTMRLGITFAVPFLRDHNLRLLAYIGRRFEQGPDFNGLGVFYQYRWNRRKSKAANR